MKSDLISVTQKNIKSHFKKGIIVDTGPLILLMGGYYNYDLIGKTSLTYEFTKEDFELLVRFLNNFREVIITPQILAEISNRVNNKLPKDKFADFIEKTIKYFVSFKEEYIKKNDILSRIELRKVGFTDISILLSSEKDNYLILTKDWKFKGMCFSKGLPVIHFDKLRTADWEI